MNSQPPRATGGIRQLFTVPENIRMAQYGHEVYGQFETLMVEVAMSRRSTGRLVYYHYAAVSALDWWRGYAPAQQAVEA